MPLGYIQIEALPWVLEKLEESPCRRSHVRTQVAASLEGNAGVELARARTLRGRRAEGDGVEAGCGLSEEFCFILT